MKGITNKKMFFFSFANKFIVLKFFVLKQKQINSDKLIKTKRKMYNFYLVCQLNIWVKCYLKMYDYAFSLCAYQNIQLSA